MDRRRRERERGGEGGGGVGADDQGSVWVSRRRYLWHKRQVGSLPTACLHTHRYTVRDRKGRREKLITIVVPVFAASSTASTGHQADHQPTYCVSTHTHRYSVREGKGRREKWGKGGCQRERDRGVGCGGWWEKTGGEGGVKS